MGIGGISIWQLLILLLVIILVFGTNKLRGIGADLGNAIKGFRNAMREGEESPDNVAADQKTQSTEPQTETVVGRVIDAEAVSRDTAKT